MEHKCNGCGWTGYGLASDGSRDGEPVCPCCKSYRVEPVEETTPQDRFFDPEGDMGSIDDYYNDLGSGMA